MEDARLGGQGTTALDEVGEATLDLFAQGDAYNDLLWRRLNALWGVRGRVLEVGCGIGNITRRILREPAVERVHALDQDPAYTERLVERFRDPRLSATACRFEEFAPPALPAGVPESFDAVVSSNVFEHLEDDEGAMRRLARLLKPGGAALILVPAHRWLFSSLDRGLSHFRRYTLEDFRRLARASGLDLIRARHFNPLGILGWWWNGRVLGRSKLPAGQMRAYLRFAVGISALADRLNPFPCGISLLGAFRRG
jgi:SAM-dependent methyltransferase